jgi:hypothetical protein
MGTAVRKGQFLRVFSFPSVRAVKKIADGDVDSGWETDEDFDAQQVASDRMPGALHVLEGEEHEQPLAPSIAEELETDLIDLAAEAVSSCDDGPSDIVQVQGRSFRNTPARKARGQSCNTFGGGGG